MRSDRTAEIRLLVGLSMDQETIRLGERTPRVDHGTRLTKVLHIEGREFIQAAFVALGVTRIVKQYPFLCQIVTGVNRL